MDSLNQVIYGNSLQAWLTALLIVLATVIVFRLLSRVVLQRLSDFAAQTATPWDDLAAHVLQKTKSLFLIVVGVYAGTLTLSLTDFLQTIIGRVAVIALLLQGGLWVNGAIEYLLSQYRRREDDAASITTMSAAGFVAKLGLWTVVLLFGLANLGVDITALVTGVGISGIAIALAVQNILGDLFASLTIVLDKPFIIRDFLVVDEHMGQVEHIGLKTTRLRSISGEQLVFSNSDLLGSRIRNYGRMRERRVLFATGVTYDTPREKLETIPQLIREAIESDEHTRFDRCHLKSFGDFSINFETVYYVTDPAFPTHMDTLQAVNLKIHELFEEHGIEFAFPTQTLHVVAHGGESGQPA